MMPGNSVAARAFNSSMQSTTAFAGAGADALIGISPTMSPTQATCTP